MASESGEFLLPVVAGVMANRSYDKLFWGLNLPAMTPPGQWFIPARRRLAKIDQVLRECGARVASSIGLAYVAAGVRACSRWCAVGLAGR
jgi:hypothetical protein